MSTIFQPPVFAGLIENLKQHRGGTEKETCLQKSVFKYKPYGLISLCFRDLSYLNKDKYFKSYNFVPISVVIPKCFSLLYSVSMKYFSILIF